MFIKANHSEIEQYPYLLEHLYRDHPNTSFPPGIDAATLACYGVYPVVRTEMPRINPFTERVLEEAPVLSNGIWTQTWRVESLPAEQVAASLSERKPALVITIDADADAIYAAALGNRATEYTQAEDQATAFRAAGYSGEVPAYVQAWADATAESPQWAADSIVATADAWRTAQAQIRAMRLLCKQQAKAATAHAELDAVAENWTAFVAQIRKALEL